MLQAGETQRRRELTINIEQGQAGFGYEAVFRPYLVAAQQVKGVQREFLKDRERAREREKEREREREEG